MFLLADSLGLDQNHGGEYAAYESLIERFITALRTCEVDPYVVLDGGSDHTDKKLETVTQRAEQRIERAHRAAKDGGKENILPIMTKWVFRQTLTRLKVPVAQCFGEADREIAALADKWQCPVLSNDSDFYIFNLSAGLLPISYFQWQDVNGNGSKSYIPCKRYYTSSFCIYFEIQRQLLPTFAALAGNDYVKLQKFIWSQFAPVASKPQSRLEGLLCWLKDFEEPEDALKAAVELMGGKSRKNKENMKKMLQSLSVGMEEYKLPRSSLMEFFIHGVIPLFLVEVMITGTAFRFICRGPRRELRSGSGCGRLFFLDQSLENRTLGDFFFSETEVLRRSLSITCWKGAVLLPRMVSRCRWMRLEIRAELRTMATSSRL